MQYSFADRMATTPRSFIREILKVTENPDIISFAGGLPNPALFPIKELAETAEKVIRENGASALQYATTEGYPPLREWIAERYRIRHNLNVSPDEILITNGSQQCLDLIGKIFINKGSPVGIERPGYLGAIQAFSMFEPVFTTVPLDMNGPDPGAFARMATREKPVFFYGVPNSQNPSGVTWSRERRREIADSARAEGLLLVEDDAYGEIRFSGDVLPLMRTLLPDQTVMCGSFSKVIAPGMRMGWLCGPAEIISQAVTAKQGTDLHSNYLTQRIICEYLQTYPLDNYIREITSTYRSQCSCMRDAIRDSFPESVTCTNPDGGMFLWVTLPDGYSSMEVFHRAIAQNVAVLPGIPFYTDGGGDTTMRLNFSNANHEMIREGIERLGKILHAYLNEPR